MSLISLWPEVKEEKLHSFCCIYEQFKCLSDNAESLKVINVMFLFQVIENCTSAQSGKTQTTSAFVQSSAASVSPYSMLRK